MGIPIIGQGGGPNQPQMNINITEDDITPISCNRCDFPLFQMALQMGKISGIKLGQSGDQLMPIGEHIICARCGWPIEKPIEDDKRLTPEQKEDKDNSSKEE